MIRESLEEAASVRGPLLLRALMALLRFLIGGY